MLNIPPLRAPILPVLVVVSSFVDNGNVATEIRCRESECSAKIVRFMQSRERREQKMTCNCIFNVIGSCFAEMQKC